MGSQLDISVSRFVAASGERVRAVMFDPLQDPHCMAAVKTVEPVGSHLSPGTLVRRTGRFLGRTFRWTTEVIGMSANHLELRIIDGPMRGTVEYRIDPDESESRVTIRNVGQAPRFAPRWILALEMRRALTADLRRLQRAVEGST